MFSLEISFPHNTFQDVGNGDKYPAWYLSLYPLASMICWQNVTGPGSRTRDINYPLTTLTLLLSPRSDIGDNVSEESGVMLISLMWWTSSSICSNQSEYILLSNSKALAPLVFFSPLRSSIVKSILTWDEEEINTSNFLPRSSLILPASSQQLCRENRTKTRWKMQARPGPKIGQSLEVLRVTTPSCDRFLGFDRFSIISMLGKQWAMQIAGGVPLST